MQPMSSMVTRTSQVSIPSRSVLHSVSRNGKPSQSRVSSLHSSSPVIHASEQIPSDHAHISSVESNVNRLALLMESFLTQQQSSFVLPSSQNEPLIPETSYSQLLSVPAWHQ